MSAADRIVVQELSSERYTGGSTHDDGCVCCGVGYAGSGPLCIRCQAPVELSRIVHRRGAAPRFVPVLGASGAGKTVYLGMLLDILTKGTQRLTGIAAGSFSVALQQHTATSLAARRFPEKTPVEAEGWQWALCDVRSRAKPKNYADLLTPDFAGESIAQEISQQGSYPAIRHVMTQAKGLLVLCDSLQVRDAALSEDLFALNLLTYLAQTLDADRRTRRKRYDKLPLAIVLTKSDACPDAHQDPATFAASNLPRLRQLCQHRFPLHRFFASTVVGSCLTIVDAYGCENQVPLHIQPHGILEPLEWIMSLS